MLTQTRNNSGAVTHLRVAACEQLSEPLTAIYCRTATQSEEAITAQKDFLMRYADNNGFIPCAAFIDDGESGAHINRPALQDMLSGIESGCIKRVLISSFSRLCRDHLLTEKLLAYFGKHSIELIAVKDGFNSRDGDTVNPMFALSGLVSEMCGKQADNNI